MQTFIALVRWTPQGARKMHELPARLDLVRKVLAQNRAELVSFNLLLGAYDAAAFVRAPDDESYAKALMAIESTGNFVATTLKVYGDEEYSRIVDSARLVRAETLKQRKLSTAHIRLVPDEDESSAA
jgi:uncharacterized protein with GYD domain